MTNRRNIGLGIILSIFIILLIWISIIDNLKPTFENRWSEDPLAMLNVLYPIFFIFIIIISIFCFIYINYRCENRSNITNVVLLVTVSLVLLYTPIYMTEWIFSPDPVRNMVVSENIQDILNNIFYKKSINSEFFNMEMLSYPGSPIFNNIFISVTNIDSIYYIKFIFPIFALIVIILIWYIFVRKLFGDNIALLSGLIAISTFFYYKIHPSPYTMGLILLFLSFYLLAREQNIISYICMIITIITMTISHPISPIMLEFYLVILAIFGILADNKGVKIKKIKFFVILTLILWIFWSIIATPIGEDFIVKLNDIVTLKFIHNVEKVGEFVIGESFIYPEIYLLNKLIYVLMLTIAYVYITYRIILQKGYKSLKNFLDLKNSLDDKLFFSYLLMHGFLISIVIMMLWGKYDLLERSLTLLTFIMSIIISYIFIEFLNKKRVYIHILIYLILTIFMISGPIINYSSSAYNSFPISEKQGLDQLSDIDLKHKNVYMSKPGYHQLSFFIDPYTETNIVKNIDRMNRSDIVTFRRTNFYYLSMRKDISFDNNTYTKAKSEIDEDKKFVQIYTNYDFDIYRKK